jgi:SAM-dependent methyltransferase
MSSHQAPQRRSAVLRAAFSEVRSAHERWMDRRLNIDTRSAPHTWALERSRFADDNQNEPLHYFLLHRYARPLRLRPDDVVVDIGCGTGRVVCWFARQPVARCIGIELSADLAELARANAARLRGRRATVEIINADAAAVDYADGTVFVLNNPFGPATLELVLARIRQSVDERPRRVRLAYITPRHEDVFVDAGWLSCYDRRASRASRVFTASYWTSGETPTAARGVE